MVESVGVTLTANWMLLLCATIVSNWVFHIDVPCLLRTRIGPDHSGHSFSTPGESLKYHQHRHYHQFLTPAIWQRWVRMNDLHGLRSFVKSIASLNVSPIDSMSSLILVLVCLCI